MKLVRTEFLVRKGAFATSQEAATILHDVEAGVRKVVWPSDAQTFTIFDKRQGNGVKPIKHQFVGHLAAGGWEPEKRMKLATRLRPGPLDAVKTLPNGKAFAVEWETGNISSTHRALNKLAIGLLEGVLCGGLVVLPTRALYYYLTDRIGNYEEIEPYFNVWRNWPTVEGVLAVLAIEHDAVSPDVPPIRKGTDGRALR